MRVLIDAHMLGTRETGNETYIANLLSAYDDLETNTEFAAVLVDMSNAYRQIEAIHLSSTNNWHRLLYGLCRAARQWHADLLHCTYVGPLVSPIPYIVSVHDVSFRRYPEYFSFRDKLLFASLYPYTLRRASAIITISEHAKNEIECFYPFVKGKIWVTLLAANPYFTSIHNPSRQQLVLNKYRIDTDFILAVGNLQPRKNLSRLIKAFTQLEQRDSLKLVVVGKVQWRSSALYTLVEQLGISSRVIFTGYVPGEDLVILYNAAKVFVYPSIYEGFGLPVLEAMACGTPVVASNTSSIPEVTGDAAVLVDPMEIDRIAQAIHHILTDKSFADQLSLKGFEQVEILSWKHTAQKTLEIYRAVLS